MIEGPWQREFWDSATEISDGTKSVFLNEWNLWRDRTPPGVTGTTTFTKSLAPMSSFKNKKSEPSSDLSRQYRRIGIRAVSAAARNALSAQSHHEKGNRPKVETDEKEESDE